MTPVCIIPQRCQVAQRPFIQAALNSLSEVLNNGSQLYLTTAISEETMHGHPAFELTRSAVLSVAGFDHQFYSDSHFRKTPNVVHIDESNINT
jgi:hypothetical protein